MLQLFEPRRDRKAAHVFADHLEATLDLAEELELLYLIPAEADRAAGQDVLTGLDRIGAFVERIEVLELAIAAKLELARAASRRIADRDQRLSTFSRLFHSGTQPLVDLWPELADPEQQIFESGHDPLTFLQARGAIEKSRCSLEGHKFFSTGEDYLLLGTVRLGAFIELCETCLREIDRHYHLYDADDDWDAARSSTLELLRERRNDAIRQALGAEAATRETPVELSAADAIDEAIELIEGMALSEPLPAVEPAMPVLSPTSTEADEEPLELVPETTEPISIALDTESVAMDAAAEAEAEAAELPMPLDSATAIEDGTALELQGRAAVDPMVPEATAPAAPIAPPAKPVPTASLLAPLASARRTLAAFLAHRRRSKPDAETEPGDVVADVADGSPEIALVEAAIELVSGVSEASLGEDPILLAGHRQRLLQLIADRAPGLGHAAGPSPGNVAAGETVAGEASSVSLEAPHEADTAPAAAATDVLLSAEAPGLDERSDRIELATPFAPSVSAEPSKDGPAATQRYRRRHRRVMPKKRRVSRQRVAR